MSSVYNTILDLCNDRGITPAKMSKQAGLSRSIMTELKSGRTKQPSAETLRKLSNFFNVPADFFLDGTPSDSDAPPEPPITDDQLMFALWGDVKDELTEEDLMEVRRYAEFVRQRKLDAKKGE